MKHKGARLTSLSEHLGLAFVPVFGLPEAVGQRAVIEAFPVGDGGGTPEDPAGERPLDVCFRVLWRPPYTAGIRASTIPTYQLDPKGIALSSKL